MHNINLFFFISSIAVLIAVFRSKRKELVSSILLFLYIIAITIILFTI